MTFVADLAPQNLWKHFDHILTIPRGSKDEERMRAYVIDVAERSGVPYKIDETGNVVARKPATPGHESAPVTILQSHLDMVNEKNSDVDHDFSKDPIIPRQDGAYLTASGTTLGSDNGIGVAAMLAVMEAKDLVHGPLELLFTVDEETGLTGAASLDGSLLEGRRLLNLDSEEEEMVYVGCAGGADSTITLPLMSCPIPSGTIALDIRLHGLKGGHSGVDIHLQRGNAVKLLARALNALSFHMSFHLSAISGGNKHNAIPREAFATVVLPGGVKAQLTAELEQEMAAIHEEFRAAEPGLTLEVKEGKPPHDVWDDTTTEKVLHLLTALPHGVLAMSYDIPDLVETSTNLATVVMSNGSLVVGMSSRSSVESALRATRLSIRAIATLAGARVEEGNGYPGWKPNLQSELLAVLKRVHERKLGHTPEIKAIHAGLECGIIGEKVPGMDMISFGPQIEFPHSPDERVKIDSVASFYELLAMTLEELA
ncbi:MAG: aminoacyl-histidine dipeptidase [Gemmatimonadota bacterium]|nr:aminoacyl-histidine dipeptidase [Gemmatimonadota bacterium]